MNIRVATTLVFAVLLASGCASQQPQRVSDPAYAPVMPAPPKTAEANNGAIYQASQRTGYSVSLFEDTKAHRVGDLVTIVLTERTDASKQASTATLKDQDIGFDSPTLFGTTTDYNGDDPFNNSIAAGRDFSGEGASSQSNQLSGSITVTVADILPNGNLVVRGEKILSLNQGDEYIRIAGIVRPMDVGADNTVPSTKVANAKISYGGAGVVAESNEMGWLARFFNSKYWPF